MPENLSAAGVSWKVYQNKAPEASNNTPSATTGMIDDFKQSADPRSDLARYGIAPTYPVDFVADVTANRLPRFPGWFRELSDSEHPAFPVASGAVDDCRPHADIAVQSRRCGKRPR